MVAVLCHFVFSSIRSEKTPREKTKRHKNAMRKDEKKAIIKNKRRNNAMRNDKRARLAMQKDGISARKDDEKTPCEKTPFETLILSSFNVAS